MPRLRVRPEAEVDAFEAAVWYERERPGLGVEFLEATRAAFRRIEEAPRQFPTVFPDIRRAILHRFPSESSSRWTTRSRRSWQSRIFAGIPVRG
jgi:hypothetical protein